MNNEHTELILSAVGVLALFARVKYSVQADFSRLIISVMRRLKLAVTVDSIAKTR